MVLAINVVDYTSTVFIIDFALFLDRTNLNTFARLALLPVLDLSITPEYVANIDRHFL